MAWQGEGANLRSPLEQVWRQFVPQGHDTALRNAFYNVAAAGFVVVAGAAAWNVYLIFQPFVRALLWAVLCGSAIHPAKTAVVAAAKTWLNTVTETSSSLTLATLLLPLHTLDTLSEMVLSYVVRHVRRVVAVTVVLPVVFIIIHYTPTMLTTLIYWILSVTFHSVAFVMSIATSNKYIVVALVCCYIIGLLVYWEEAMARVWLSRLSVAVWLLVGAAVAGWLVPESATQPVFAVFCGALLLGLAVEVIEYMKTEKQDGVDSTGLVESVVKVCKDEYQHSSSYSTTKSKCVRGLGAELEAVNEEEEAVTGSNKDEQEHTQKDILENIEEIGSDAGSGVLGADTPVSGAAKAADAGSEETTSAGSQRSSDSANYDEEEEEESPSNTYIKGVLIACVVVELWRHHYLLVLLPAALIYFIIKKTTSVCLSGDSLGSAVQSVLWRQWDRVAQWTRERKDAIMPPPVRGVIKVLYRSEDYVLHCISGSLDALVASFFILAALVFIVSAAIFLSVQIQGESMQLVSVGSQIINSTVVNNPQFIALLPDDIGNTLSSAAENAYLYGRDWLTKWVRDMVGEADSVKALALEKQVLELWDRVYQAWVIAPPMDRSHPPLQGPVVTSQAVADTFDKLVQGIANSPGLVSFDALSQLIKDNVGTILSVAESVWTLLLSNVSLVLSLTTASASAVLGGSLSLLNAAISAVVFLTALFYVLASDSSTYKPVSVLSNLAPGQMKSVGTALEEAINGVFTASLKMGVFYGLWTWLLHSIFATNIVYIPAVLGALFGAVPLVGTYWACIPGILELWWGHNSPTLALLLLLCQLAPLSCVDTAIYAEIKGGGHPYLTGLAVGGGIFCWGAEGAILGPLLLCILLVATNLYAALILPPPPQPSNRFSRLRRNLALVQQS